MAPAHTRTAITVSNGSWSRRCCYEEPGRDEEKYDQPPQKPVDRMRRQILNHTKRGELVHEPFLGSLTAAEMTERVCYRLELLRHRLRRIGCFRSC
jgi:DNA modification methylase